MNSQVSSEPAQIEPLVREVAATCPRHGAYMAKQIPVPMIGRTITSPCGKCGEERNLREATAKAEQEQRDHAARIARLFDRSGIPARFMDRTLANYAASNAGQKRALRIAERYVEAFDDRAGVSLVFAGKPGTGKTHLACGIGHALIQQSRTVQFLTVLQALRHIKDTYRRDSDRSESDAMDDMIEPGLLILDEVGAQLGSEHEKMLMFEIINERYQQCRSTILISNLTSEELTEFLGDRLMDRFRESGAVVAFDWTSHRGTQA